VSDIRQGVDLREDVFPLFLYDDDRPRAFLGTGFLIAPTVLLTCWHCVPEGLTSGQYVAAVATLGSGASVYRLEDLSQDENGTDLAIARIDRGRMTPLTLAEPVLAGTDVLTVGYPLTRPPDQRNPRWQLEPRFLQGYVTRIFDYDMGAYRATRAYELDMLAPPV
jgi:V8-like Glu-specific endopeptidase